MKTITLISILVVLFSTFFITWLFYLKTNKASWVDTIWSLNHGWIVLWLYWSLPNQILVHTLYLVMYLAWSTRLALYLGIRTANSPEDARYQNIEKRWKKNPKLKMLRFFGIQGLVNIVLCLPAWFLFYQTNVPLDSNGNVFTWIGASLFVIGWIGETLSDFQLAQHKKNRSPHSVCQSGLWKYSRHPNYFFEFTIWVGFATFLLSFPYGWTFISIPLIMLYLLLYKTGIPETEAHLRISKGEEYARYQRRTSRFFPLPPQTQKVLS